MIKKVSPIDIEGIYRNYLDTKQEENRKERYEGNEHWYHASGAGSCSRKLYFESVEQAEVTNPIDHKTNRLLRLGNIVHEDIQNSLTQAYYNNIYNNNIHNNVKEIAITPHKDNELVCGFMYIKNKNSLETLCDELLHIAKVGEEVLEEKFKQMPHEMRLLGYIDKKLKDQNYITRLPVSPFEPANNLYDVFEGVFDPSTYGQYFGNNNTVHKDDVNRLADRYIGSKVFPTFGNDKKPFLRLENGNEVPIFNLHVHNKQLHEYFSLR